MSETRAVVREEIRLMLGDTSSSDTSFSNEQINRSIQRHMRLIGNEVWQGQAWVVGAVSCSAGTADYTLPAGVEYRQVINLKLQPVNFILRPQSTEQLEFFRQGTQLTIGQPVIYALWEDTSQLVNLRLWPIPDKTYTIDIERSVIPAALTGESSVLPFSENLITALEYRVAAELLARADDNIMQQLGLGANTGAAYAATAEKAIMKEKERISRLYATPFITRVER